MLFHFENLVFSAINKKNGRAFQRPVRFAGIGALTSVSTGCEDAVRLNSSGARGKFCSSSKPVPFLPRTG